MFRWIGSWLTVREIRNVSKQTRKASLAVGRSVCRLERCRKKLASDRRLLNAITETVAEDLDRADETVADVLREHRSYEEAMEALNSKLKVVEEITVPALVESHKVQLERWKAETAVQVRRQVSVGREE